MLPHGLNYQLTVENFEGISVLTYVLVVSCWGVSCFKKRLPSMFSMHMCPRNQLVKQYVNMCISKDNVKCIRSTTVLRTFPETEKG